MSDTQRGEKPGGFEYWSRRPHNNGGGAYNPRRGNKLNKRRTHKAERQAGRREIPA